MTVLAVAIVCLSLSVPAKTYSYIPTTPLRSVSPQWNFFTYFLTADGLSSLLPRPSRQKRSSDSEDSDGNHRPERESDVRKGEHWNIGSIEGRDGMNFMVRVVRKKPGFVYRVNQRRREDIPIRYRLIHKPTG